MLLLPKLAMLNTYPAIYDFESLTTIEQTARVYGAMNEMIADWNKFAETVNSTVDNFSETEQEKRAQLEENVKKVLREFVCSMDQHLKLNLEGTATKLINDAINEGRILVETYDPETESLKIGLRGGV